MIWQIFVIHNLQSFVVLKEELKMVLCWSKHNFSQMLKRTSDARVVELVDTRDLKSLVRKDVPVQVRPRAPFIKPKQFNVWAFLLCAIFISCLSHVLLILLIG